MAISTKNSSTILSESRLADSTDWDDMVNDLQNLDNNKVDKVAGKVLSDNNYTTTEKNKVANVPADTNTELANKVDKVAGKGLSKNDYTDAEKSKLASLSITYVGTFTTLSSLAAAIPTGQAGWEAIVDGGAGSDPQKAFWDSSDNQWVIQTGGGASSFSELAGNPNDNAALAAALAAKANSTHSHAISDVTGLSSALDAKADDNAVVKLTGAQTIAGAKEFTSGLNAFRGLGTAITGTAYTLALADRNTFIESSNASAQTITVPANASVAFPIGTEIEICRAGAGEITISPAGGVTLRSAGSRFRIAEQEGCITLKKVGTDTWRMIGGTKV